MKPLQLRLQAFGPFRDSVSVSFDRVFDGGLFLIHGRTGAGKTSLLDGLCFSLFGRPSAQEREKDLRALRSDLAPQEMLTETELIFAIGSTIYRVHRVPTQMTPKKRGEGLTELKGSAELFQLVNGSAENRDLSNAEWRPLAQKVEAVDEAIEKLLGMNERQFRQVVVLPQGQFREFLSSSSTERQAILEKLFQTDRFSRLQQHIAAKAKADESQWRVAGETLRGKLEAAGLASADEIEEKKNLAKSSLESESELLSASRTRAHDLAAELGRAKEFTRTQERLTALKDEALALDAKLSENEQRRELVKRSRLWLPFFRSSDRVAELEVKSRDLLGRRDRLEASVKDTSERDRTGAETLKALAARLPSLEELSQKRTALRETAIALQDIEKSSQSLESEARKIEDSRRTLEASRVRISGIEAQRIQSLALARSLDRTEHDGETRDLEMAIRGLSELELAFHRSEAARLAKLLKAGDPCPVCGSLSHPDPAHARIENAPNPKDLDAAKSQVESLRQRVAAARSQRATLLGRYREIETETFSKDDLTNETASNFAAALSKVDAFEKELKKTNQDLELLKTETLTREEAVTRARADITKKRASLGIENLSYADILKQGLALKTEQESREAEIKKAETTHAEIKTELSKLSGQLSALGDEIERLAEERRTETEKRDRLKEDAPGPQPDRIEENALQSIDRDVTSFFERHLKNKTALEELSEAAKSLKATRAVDTIQVEANDAAVSRDRLEESVARLRLQFETLVKLESESKSGLETLSRLQASADRSARLSALVAGDRSQNKLLVPLSRFVLQSRFDDVLEQANRRLARMSRGQFQLRRPALSRNLRDSQGLELSVEDAVAGKERHAGSLSGGESFMAALSLALGLADVVQADLGGVRLDTVLIDEGFGTLDSESLDLAMKTLIDLQAGGRMVGIISHVQELKSQVPEQLEVVKSVHGSQVSWIRSNDFDRDVSIRSNDAVF